MPRKKISAQALLQGEDIWIIPHIEQKLGCIYLRVSTDQQKKDWHSIESQEINCKKRADQNNIKIIWVWKDEWISGNSIQDRKEFMKAIHFLKDKNKKTINVHYFICDSTSRFSRNHKIEKTYELVWEVQKTGAELVAVSYGGIVDTDSEMGMMQAGFSFLIDSLESKRWQTRVMNGMKSRMLNGYWTFAIPPLWYKFESVKTGDKTNKILIPNEPDYSILANWLSMFWDGKIITKQELYLFLQDSNITSNSKYNKTWKLHLSIIDRILEPRKLLVYAWYLTYPDRWIHEKIPAKHKPLITVPTMEKILKRLGKHKNITNMKTNKYWSNINEYPLRWILFCPACDKKMTGRASKSQTGDLHYYYWCNNNKCSMFKKTLRREKLHTELRNILLDITPSKNITQSTERIFKQIRNNKRSLREDSLHRDKDRVKAIEKEMATLMDKILTINNPIFEKEAAKRYELLEEEKNQLIEKSGYDPLRDTEMLNLLQEAQAVITNPVSIWDIADHNMKKLLINLLFKGKLYYDKKMECYTFEVSLIYELFKQQKNINPKVYAFGGP